MKTDFYKSLSKKLIPNNDNTPPVHGIYPTFFKPLLDRTIALILLIALLPLFIIISILIKLESKGSIFFRQERVGYKGKIFHIFKFRSMSVMENGNDVVQAGENDTRITKVGKFIRKTSIDELPQLINVLLGDMSLVGPRPHAVSHDIEFTQRVTNYQKRHMVLPGITGLAQIKGFRGPTDTDEKLLGRVENDIQYTKSVSFITDMNVIFKTAFLVFNDKQAF